MEFGIVVLELIAAALFEPEGGDEQEGIRRRAPRAAAAAEQREGGSASVGRAHNETWRELDNRSQLGGQAVEEERVIPFTQAVLEELRLAHENCATSKCAGVKAELEAETYDLLLHVEGLPAAILVRASELSARSGLFDKLLNGPFQEGALARKGLRDLHITVPEPGAFTAALEYVRLGRLNQHPTCCQLVPGFLANADYLLLDGDVRDYVSRMWATPDAYAAGEIRLVLVHMQAEAFSKRSEWAAKVVEAHERHPNPVAAAEATLAARSYFEQIAEARPSELWLQTLSQVHTRVDQAAFMAVLPPPARVVTAMLKNVCCSRCGGIWTLLTVASNTGVCPVNEHPGHYEVNEGWSCCGELRKRTVGCSPTAHTFTWT